MLDDNTVTSRCGPSAGSVTDPLTVNTQSGAAVPDTLHDKDSKPQVSPGTSVFIAEQVYC